MNFSLSDLVPPLRWSDAAAITLLRGQPDLPEAWWRSLPMPRVLGAIGPESLGELLTEIALDQWPAAAIGDVLPALHVLDPEDADDPHVAIALDRAGSWPGLLSLTSRELMDQPFIQARPVLNALFCAVFVRLARPRSDVSAINLAHPEPVKPVLAESALAEPVFAEPVLADLFGDLRPHRVDRHGERLGECQLAVARALIVLQRHARDDNAVASVDRRFGAEARGVDHRAGRRLAPVLACMGAALSSARLPALRARPTPESALHNAPGPARQSRSRRPMPLRC